MARNSQSLYDRHITIFSPEGKLFQVEYAFRAVKGCNLTTVAVRGQNCACVAVQKKGKLLDTTSVTSLHNVTDEIGGVMVGMPGDCRAILVRARSIAGKFQYEKGYKIPVHVLAQKVANLNQVFTQHAYMRLQACCGILIGIDEETKSPCIYKFDPAGWFAGYKACAAGAKEQEATNALEKLVKKAELDTPAATAEAALSCLQSVLAVDFRPSEVEVGIVTTDQPLFARLSEAEIEEHLTRIAERD